jgi:hypothetical protein
MMSKGAEQACSSSDLQPNDGRWVSGRSTSMIYRTARAMAVRLAARPASPACAAATAATAAADASAVATAAVGDPAAVASRDAASAMSATRPAVMLPQAAQQAATASCSLMLSLHWDLCPQQGASIQALTNVH